MATPESITELWTNFKSLVKKVTYDKTEVDNKLSQKANNTLSTVSANGLMSSNDKTKLDGIESGANKTVVDTSISPTSTNPVQNRVINTELASKASTAIATTSKNGLMSAADKTKLNGISTEANKTIVDSALSTTSTNPVQNKVINSEITSLNNSLANHTHHSLDIVPDFNNNPTNVQGGYNKIMQIKVTGTYADMPIVFEIHHRNDPTPMKCYLSFAPSADKDPILDYFKYEGKSTHNVYAHKDSTGTWSIIAQEVGTYQSTSITNIRYSGYMRNIISITKLSERLTSLPSDCTQCTSYLASTSEITSLNSTITNKVGDIQSALDKIIGV